MSKWALIIGGSSGIGLATVKKLADNSFRVIVAHRDRRSTAEVFQKEVKKYGDKIIPMNFDAINPEKIAENLETIKNKIGEERIDLMVHSLSRGNLKPLFACESPTLSDQDMILTMESMAMNFLTWSREIVRNKLFSEKARIISLTSAGSEKAWEGYAAVGVAKAALETISKYMAVELAPFGIRVNTINAGVTDTPSLKAIPGSEKLKEKAKANNPFKRITRPEDVANAIYLLTLPEADWVNGSLIHVDGGEHLVA